MGQGNSLAPVEVTSTISFVVNGIPYTVENPQPNAKLVTWLRTNAHLTGTKYMCQDGGCGSCVITLKRQNPGSGEFETIAVNSCLFPLLSANGCQITTVEGLGSSNNGYSVLQQRVADFNATQCGYCTPGFVMTMNSLLENNPNPTEKEIESEFDGNICRCTGYRPIMDAMKSFASDANPKIQKMCRDIEDAKLCPKTNKRCEKKGVVKIHKQKPDSAFETLTSVIVPKPLFIKSSSDDWTWIQPTSLDEVVAAVNANANKSIRFVVGYTAPGVYKEGDYDVYIDTKLVPDFYTINDGTDLEIGSNVSLSNLANLLKGKKDAFPSLGAIYELVSIMANTPVRNAGCWIGNLIMKKQHPDFASDLFTVFEAAGVTLVIRNCSTGIDREYQLTGDNGFRKLDLDGKVILLAKLPKVRSTTKTIIHASSYKVKPRQQNSAAYVNASFTANVTGSKIPTTPSLVFGGISGTFVHASDTEAYLVGKDLSNKETLSGALSTLEQELTPTMSNAADSSVEYRRSVACGLFYKFYLTICNPSDVGMNMKSASTTLQRNVSTASQSYTPDPTTYPMSQAMPKLNAIQQAAGETRYINDSAAHVDEGFATFVLASVANADIDNIDTSDALAMPGCTDIITAADLASRNLGNSVASGPKEQVLLAESHVDYAGQPVAIVVADNSDNAFSIANAVKVTYKNQSAGIYTTTDGIAQGSFFNLPDRAYVQGDPDTAIAKADYQITGQVNTGKQYHFYIETQICRVEQTDIGMDVYCATQNQDQLQDLMCTVMGWPGNKINIITGRLGGAYGGKAPNSFMSGVGAVVASYITDKTIRFVTNMAQCMEALGYRPDYNVSYKTGFNSDGTVQGFDITYTAIGGATPNQDDVLRPVLRFFADSGYYCPNWKLNGKLVKANVPTASQVRSPTSAQLAFVMDHIIDHISNVLHKDPMDVQQINLYQKGQTNLFGDPLTYCSLGTIYQQLLNSANVAERQQDIQTFNAANTWKKKGLAMSPVKFPMPLNGVKYAVLVSIFHRDGSVVISHGGIEMGQGLSTKVIQVAAYNLGIPVDLIKTQRTTSEKNANSINTGGSVGSDVNCLAVQECCKILNDRINPVREKMKSGATWQDVIAQCYSDGVNLIAQYTSNLQVDTVSTYQIYGVTCSEVELDVLTGERNLLRVDILYDCGISLNPDIDIGQVEGGFMMGVGMHTTENLVYDPSTGKLLTNSTWNYKPPMNFDIPEVWNVALLADAPNPNFVLRSKASGETPLVMSDSVVFALKRCVQSFLGSDDYVQIDSPATIEEVHDRCKVSITQMTMK